MSTDKNKVGTLLVRALKEKEIDDRSASEIFAEMSALVADFLDSTDNLIKKEPGCQR